MEQTEILDSLQGIIISVVKSVFKQAGKEITDQEAKNVLAKIGTRIVYEPEFGKEEIDKILFNK